SEAPDSNGIREWTQPRPFSLRNRARSFLYAGRGFRTLITREHNAWIHAAATVAVVAAGLTLRIDRTDWALLILAMMAVWTAESLNTAVELLADAALPEFHPLVRKSKDVAAAAVLIAAGGALLIGILVFVPHVSRFF
ncbi:MAG: diacylglycerol kinase family protein, partial [Planctomyces sp.]